MALPEDLLAQARHLARREPKRPKQASLRRALSAAYYALYHLLIIDAARVLAPARPLPLRARVRRAFSHDDMKKVCEQFQHGRVRNLGLALQQLVTEPLEPEIATVANAFVELQEARHGADYDSTQTFNRSDVLITVAMAEQAFTAWKRIRTSPNAAAFLAALLLNRHWRPNA